MDALATVRAVLAADLACDEADLLAEGVWVVLAEEHPGRRRFSRGPRVLAIATMGAGVVVSCDAWRLEWARAELGRLDRNQLFTAAVTARIAARVEQDGQMLAGPDLKLVCAPGDLRPAEAPGGVAIEVVGGPAVAELYRHRGFRHALSYLTGSPRPDMLAAIARIDGEAGSSTGGAGSSTGGAGSSTGGAGSSTEGAASSTEGVVGVAGASADCEELWQIGVDVVEGQRGRGIGRAIVGRLTAEVLALGRVPYYSTVVSNLRSSRLALGLGYRLAWVELYARAPWPGATASAAGQE